MTDLKPCPFCGKEPIITRIVEDDDYDRWFHVRCEECAIEMGEEYRADAIEQWNRRAALPASSSDGLCERLEEDAWYIEKYDGFVGSADRIVRNTLDAITALRSRDARIAELEAALDQIANLNQRPYEKFPADWQDQISACPECKRYEGHPVQRGICDDHRRPLYAREAHDKHETQILGYRAMSVARDALIATRASLIKEQTDVE